LASKINIEWIDSKFSEVYPYYEVWYFHHGSRNDKGRFHGCLYNQCIHSVFFPHTRHKSYRL